MALEKFYPNEPINATFIKKLNALARELERIDNLKVSGGCKIVNTPTKKTIIDK
jgi:hypothetical protein